MAQFISSWGNYPPQLCAALNEMNEQQQKVCRLSGGLAAVIGVPGSGKTRALVNLLARSVSDGLDPDKILAMTFTRAAATEMNDRLSAMGIVGARVGTIHSVCRQILASESSMTQEAELDTKGQLSLELKKCLADMRRYKKIPQRGVDKDSVASFIGAAKARGCVHVEGDPFRLNMKLFAALADEAKGWAAECGMDALQLIEVYQDMEKRRAGRVLYDFDDMLLWAWLVLVSNPDARQRWRYRWSTIIVDETQDSNPVQWDFARLLAGLESCIFRPETEEQVGAGGYIQADSTVFIPKDDGPRALYVFGDSAQSIYKFRAAVPELFVEFADREDVTVIPLPYNYRSIPSICAVGTALVRGKPWHLGGEMISSNDKYILTKPDDYPPKVDVLADQAEEAAAAVRWALELAEGAGDGLNECAILSRTSMALHLAEIECIRARIPYRKMCAGSFFDSKEVKDILAYLKVACGLDHSGWDLRRTINTPFRYISKAFIDQCTSMAQSVQMPVMDMMLQESGQLSYRPRQALQEWVDLLAELNQMAVVAEEATQENEASRKKNEIDEGNVDRVYVGPAAMIATVMDRTDYVEHLRKEEGLGQEDGRLAILGELQRMAAEFRSPVEFLNYVDELSRSVKAGKRQLGRSEDDKRPALTLSTIHRAKGLEWTYVRLVDVMEGRFPHKYANDQDEELRLLFVAITRAKEECVITASVGTEKKGPSEFIGLVQKILKTITSTEDHAENRPSDL